MNIPEVRFGCTMLSGTNKVGKLPKDQYGYYIQPLGALNCFNSAGAYYPYEAAKQLFTESAPFMRRIQNGDLKAEEGHPKPLPGQSEDSYFQRVNTIVEANVCAHIAEVWLDFNSIIGDNGRPVVAIMGKVKPSGPFGPALEESYENPRENVNFSVRSFTEDTRSFGIVQKKILEIVTFDHVTEPGIAVARKFRAPGLESMCIDLQEHSFTREAAIAATRPSNGVGMEASALMTARQLFRALKWDDTHMPEPKFLNW